jgi:hypothetical protein
MVGSGEKVKNLEVLTRGITQTRGEARSSVNDFDEVSDEVDDKSTHDSLC